MKVYDTMLTRLKNDVYDPCGLILSHFETETESKDYGACRFQLNGLHSIGRTAKITPKKLGQFVTFWKRLGNGPIVPFNDTDPIDFYTVIVRSGDTLGQFVFPRSILLKKRIMTTNGNEGKRAFRVYPSWDTPNNKQAERTQKWQAPYFYTIGTDMDYGRIAKLYAND